jgi:DivIVA domain-containing protein
VSTTFPKTRKRGYNVEQVEDFLEEARRAYSADLSDTVVVSAESIRTIAFAMQKGGYSTTHVDAALERLEDAFATRERERSRQREGDDAWYGQARASAQEILNRLARPRGHRFDRAPFLVDGYDRRQVDALADRIAAYLQTGASLSVDDVRTAAFPPRKGGYREAQVDLLLDAVTTVMLAVR